MEGRILPLMDGYFGNMYPRMYARSTFYAAGQDSFTLPPGQNPDLFQALTNVLPTVRGTLQKRWGYTLFATSASTIRRIQSYQNESSVYRRLVLTNPTSVQTCNEDGTGIASLFTPTGTASPKLVDSRDYGFFYDGASADLQKWSGSALSKWGIVAPVTAISVGVPSAGPITIVAGRNYFLVFQNPTTGQLSDLSPVSASTGPLAAQQVPLTNLEVSADPQVTQKFILATLDGGDQTNFKLVASLPNATTTYTDTTTEATLSASNVYQETDTSGFEHGVADNTPPPNCTEFIKHRGRFYGFSGPTVFFSKNLDDLTTSTGTICGRYEECWPATYFMDISEGAENIRGLLTDGQILYVGTQRHIRRILGDSPANFETPEVIFSEVGLLNQEVWKITFNEGQPVGAMWLTPDYRIIGSDFNTYRDVGTPVQDVLNTINTAQASKAQATYFGSKAFDFYALAVPTGSNVECDTVLIFDLRRKLWSVWTPQDVTTALFYNVDINGNPQLLFGANNGPVYQYLSTATTDNGTTIVSTAKTSWLDFTDPSSFKFLNEVEVMTGDIYGLKVSVEGASTDYTFGTPNLVAMSRSLVQGPRGQYKVYLAGSPCRDKFYRLTFVSTGTPANQSFLDYIRVEVLPINRL